jgi:hypothetical protein
VTFVPQKTNIACFKHNRVETNCSKVGVFGNAVTGFQFLNMLSSGTESDSSASGDVDYGEFGYQLEPEYTEEELRQMEEAASAQRREIENHRLLK